LVKLETDNSNKKEKINKDEINQTNKKIEDEKNLKLKRDKSSMQDYYKEWDKFKVDSEDEEISDKDKENSIKPKGIID